jgi:adenosylcobinamide-GDP ribazoletransferase
LAVVIAVAFAALSGMVTLVLVAIAATTACAAIAKAKIGGQTGDILGATQQITEMAMLIAVVGMVT